MTISHIRELFDYNRWANALLFDVVGVLSDGDLDRAFEIGPGTIRKTIQHSYGAERIWYERIEGPGYSNSRAWDEIHSADDLRDESELLHIARDAWLASLSDANLLRTFTYTLRSGEECTSVLGDILIHVADHAIHHRAQLANMTRHVGEPFTNSDYLHFRLARPTLRPPNAETSDFLRNAGMTVGEDVESPRPLSPEVFVKQYAYNDWANDLLIDAAAALSDAQLDQPFEMGIGSFRKTMLHIESAERYWLAHWCGDANPKWAELDDATSMAALQNAWQTVREEREAFFEQLDDAMLLGEIAATPAPGMLLEFRLGETIAQVAMHGTHHRAQALNMLRHLADVSMRMDMITFSRL